MPIKQTKGNKGEWSEFYAFIKILTDKKVFAADENLENAVFLIAVSRTCATSRR